MLRKFTTTCILFLCLLTLPHHVSRAKAPVAQRPINDIYVVLFVLDGCRSDILYKMIREGELPTLKEYFVDNGTYFTDAITVFPSTTSTGYQAMVSGLFPGHSGIPYLEWMPRDTLKVKGALKVGGHHTLNGSFANYYVNSNEALRNDNVPLTIFDYLAGYPTATVYSLFAHTSTINGPKLAIAGAWAAFVRGKPERLDVFSGRRLMRHFSAPMHKVPRFAQVGMLATDLLGHKKGTYHPRINANLKQFDQFFASFVEKVRSRGILDRTYFIISSDHGMHDIVNIFDLRRVLKQAGLKFLRRSADEKSHVFLGMRGVSSATLTVRGSGGWQEPISYDELRDYPAKEGRVDLVHLLADLPITDLLLVRDGTARVRVFHRDEEGWLEQRRRKGETLYRYIAKRGDPLGLRRARLGHLTRGRWLTNREWNHRLRDTDIPGAVPQLAHIFDDGSAGDMYLIADLDWGFYRKKWATHGTHRAADVRVPLMIHGPGITARRRGVAQTTDIYPTLLQWYGLPYSPELIDGQPLF